MKIYFKIFLFCILIQPSFCLENKIYSISVCTTSSKESANICKKNILETSNLETFVQENLNKNYSVYLGKFTTYYEAKKVLNNSSNFIKKQKPFIKEIENNINVNEIERKIKEVDEEIKRLDEKIINVNEKEKALAEVQRMESEKVLADEQRKETELEAQRIKEENKKVLAEVQKNKQEKEKALAEVQRMESEKVLADEQRKETELEAQRIKEENKKVLAEVQKNKQEKEKALAEVQRMKSEKVLADEQRKETELEAQRVKDENKKVLAEVQKNKQEKEKALAEVQRMESEKVLADEQRKETELEAQRIKEENKKVLAEVQRMKSEKVLADEQRKETELEAQRVKDEKNSQKLNELDNFKNLVIKVDSVKNIMFLKGENSDGKIIDIKTYKVSTAKTSIKKPLGTGSITSISLNPQWNPTSKTLKAFREKGINLPSIVPYGDKLNYMGAAKINLTHRVNGQQVYRIHGTLSENTIGTNESAGCIRMKNKEVVELATLLEKFSKIKSFDNISVILE